MEHADVGDRRGWPHPDHLTIDNIDLVPTAFKFSGLAGQIEQAFHTPIHQYLIDGQWHRANSIEPQIPLSLATTIAGVGRLNDFDPASSIMIADQMNYNAETNVAKPSWTSPAVNGALSLILSPKDFNVQYDVPSFATGDGVTIGIIGNSNIDVSLVRAYRSLFGLGTAELPRVIVSGNDPGVLNNRETVEAYLDVELAGAVAPMATINFYTSNSIEEAASVAVDDNVASVLSASVQNCEASLGASGNLFWNALWQQAAAQGQT